MGATAKLRGWIRVSPRHSDAMQRDALTAAGCGAIYCGPDETVDDLLRSLRAGDTVLVTTLARLAARRRDLAEILPAIHSAGAVVQETTTGHRSDRADQLQSMLFRAIAEQTGDSRGATPEEARRRQVKSVESRLANTAERRTPESVARSVWRDLSLTNAEALAQPEMYGWTEAAAYRILKRRNTLPGAKAGRPRRERK